MRGTMLILLEGIVMCFVLLIICVIGIAKEGPVGLVTFYEKNVQERVVELGLTTPEKIRKQTAVSGAALLIPMLVLVPYMVYCINGVRDFKTGSMQMVVISLIFGLFDRIFIDWYWVGHTKAWQIPGTEDLKPYIPGKTLFKKWFSTLVFAPLIYVLMAWIIDRLV